MKFEIEKEILVNHLNKIIKGVSTRNLIPILSCIKFELKEDCLILLSTNNDISIKTIIRKEQIKNIEETGSIAIYGKFIFDIVRKMEKGIISFETLIDDKLNIYNDHSSFFLNCNNVHEYPVLDFNTKEDSIRIKEKDFLNIINKTNYACSLNEDKPALTGINFKTENEDLIVCATDSYRLSLIKEKIEKLKTSIDVTIPVKNINELTKMLENSDSFLNIHFFQNYVLFQTEDFYFISRTINNSFPNVLNIIPTEFKINVNLNVIDFFNALDRASLFAKEETKQTINLTLKNNTIEITSNIQEIGRVIEKLEINNDNDKEFYISFSSKYMMDALKNIDTQNVNIFFNDSISSIVIKSSKDDNYVQLFQPIKTF